MSDQYEVAEEYLKSLKRHLETLSSPEDQAMQTVAPQATTDILKAVIYLLEEYQVQVQLKSL